LFQGFHVYESAQLKGAEMKGLLNEHQFPDDFIAIREGDHLRVSKLQLTHDVFFANLQVSQDISGIPVMEDGALGAKLFNKTLNISRVFKEYPSDFTENYNIYNVFNFFKSPFVGCVW
jgi:hypothetical protein